MAKLSGGQVVVKALEREGVRVVFGLPGVHNLPIVDALGQQETIRYVGVRHEQAAAYMADGYARASGRVGVCVTTTGPGAANTLAALGEAYTASSPVLQLTTQIPLPLLGKGKGFLHETKDQLGMFWTVAGWVKRAETFQEIATAIHEAMVWLRGGRPRPAVLEIPTDILYQQGVVEFLPRARHRRRPGEPGAVAKAAKLLAGAKRPLIWAGGGAASSRAGPELARLAEVLQAPVMTTYMGKGALPEDHPLSLGYAWSWGEVREVTEELLRGADLLLAVGTRFSALTTGEWSLPLPANLIHIDIDPGEIGKNYPAALGVVGDAKAVLGQIVGELEREGLPPRPSRLKEMEELREIFYAIVSATRSHQLEIVDELRLALKRDAILVNDMTIAAYTSSRHFPVYGPRCFLYPYSFGTLGFGFPAALGAKVAQPRRQVVALCGDGGFMFNLAELATAAQHHIKVVALVVNDRGYGVLRGYQDHDFAGRHFGTELVNPDFVQLARAFGVRAERVAEVAGVRAAVLRALARPGPSLIEVTAPILG
ncbi:MAG: thiamine pyrophosphate-binding protein [Chloroflexi bacterium]|nr:thiamine pyrophosphate-binding protein [Chloroflexota bacterium]